MTLKQMQTDLTGLTHTIINEHTRARCAADRADGDVGGWQTISQEKNLNAN
jgi:hypothetical protein